MSLLITNKKTLKNFAIITIANKTENLTFDTKDDLTIIKSGDKVVGLNINNFSNYFKALEGAHTINQAQLDAIEKLGFKIEDPKSLFSIGVVTERKPHPKSEKLFILKVRTDKDLEIVTNTLNSTIGQKVVVANIGATLPSGIPIVLSKVMGVKSEGMLCGGETLGFEKTDGIYIPDGESGTNFIL